MNAQLLAGQGSVLYAAGHNEGHGGVARSDDDGLTFQLLTAAPPLVTELQILRNGHVFATTFVGARQRSKDGGATWTAVTSGWSLPYLEDETGRLFAPNRMGGFSISTDEIERGASPPAPSRNQSPEIKPEAQPGRPCGYERVVAKVVAGEGLWGTSGRSTV